MLQENNSLHTVTFHFTPTSLTDEVVSHFATNHQILNHRPIRNVHK